MSRRHAEKRPTQHVQSVINSYFILFIRWYNTIMIRNTQRNDVSEDAYSVPHSRRHGPRQSLSLFVRSTEFATQEAKFIVTPNSRLQGIAWIQTFALRKRTTVERHTFRNMGTREEGLWGMYWKPPRTTCYCVLNTENRVSKRGVWLI